MLKSCFLSTGKRRHFNTFLLLESRLERILQNFKYSRRYLTSNNILCVEDKNSCLSFLIRAYWANMTMDTKASNNEYSRSEWWYYRWTTIIGIFLVLLTVSVSASPPQQSDNNNSIALTSATIKKATAARGPGEL